MRIETLTRMANQIAINNEAVPLPEAVDRVAVHLDTFWTPAMRRELTDYVLAHPDSVDPVVLAALVE